jgi:hypothetical protein
MIQVNTDAHGLLVRPINMQVDGPDFSTEGGYDAFADTQAQATAALGAAS